MIGAKIMLDDDRQFASVYLREKPAVGEYLWFSDPSGQIRRDFGATSFLVREIAHWVNEEWSPATHTGEPIQTLAIYVEPNSAGA